MLKGLGGLIVMWLIIMFLGGALLWEITQNGGACS